MKTLVSIGRSLAAALTLLFFTGALQCHAASQVLVVTLDGAITPAAADYVVRALRKAADTNSELLVLKLDTPGGLDTSMRSIIKAILASRVPVATFVAPEGARAASAGPYILYASHIAAMAPATNLGAATPVAIGGSEPAPDPNPTPAPSPVPNPSATPTQAPGAAPSANGDTS